MYYTIYKITNKINNKIYIGAHATNNLNDNYMGSGIKIKKSIKKYGIDNFKKEIMYYLESYEEMFKKEKEIITKDFLMREDVYNLAYGGDGGFRGEDSAKKQSLKMKGRKRTLDSRKKQGLTNKGRKDKPEVAQKKADNLKKYKEEHPEVYINRKRSPESIKKTVDKLKNRKVSLEQIEKQKQTMKLYYENHCGPNTGRKFSKETREKMSLSRKNKPTNRGRKVRNIDTGEVFPTICAASRFYSILPTGIRDTCIHRQNKCGGFRWEYADIDKLI